MVVMEIMGSTIIDLSGTEPEIIRVAKRDVDILLKKK
jgi:hypothetical protein